MEKKHYYAYKTQMRGKESYSLLPLCSEALFVEGLFYPEERFLLLLSKDTKDKFHLLDKINAIGEPEKDPKFRRDKKERVRLETNYEHYLVARQDLEWFAGRYIENAEEFLAFIDKVESEEPEEKPELAAPVMQVAE